MSDRSSESSEDWILLNEDDSDLFPNATEQSLNLELSYSALCNAVSDSIGSSLSSEELEWQYEQYENFINPAYSPSYVEDLDPKEFGVECIDDSNVSQVDDNDINLNNSALLDDPAPVSNSKIYCYKHERNDNLNFILNLILALAISSTFGLGIGHFLGWSHKCFTKVKESNKPTAVLDNLPDILIKQNREDVGVTEKKITPLFFTDNLSDSLPCENLKEGSISTHLTSNIQPNSNIFIEANWPDILMSTNVLDLKNLEISQNFSDSKEVLPINLNSNLIHKNDANHFEVESQNKYFIDDESSLKEIKKFYHSDEIISDNVNNLPKLDEVNKEEFELLKEMYIKDANFNEESDLTNQLRGDLNHIVQSLSAIALTRLNNFKTIPVEDSKTVLKLYIDFQDLINAKITNIDNVISSAEFKTHQKSGVKYLQKMVHCLVDSVDYLMRATFKTLSKRNKAVDSGKIFNDISKVIFVFNKKWEKHNRIWEKNVERAKMQEFRVKKFKDNKQLKKRTQFDKDNSYRRYNKFKRYSMRS